METRCRFRPIGHVYGVDYGTTCMYNKRRRTTAIVKIHKTILRNGLRYLHQIWHSKDRRRKQNPTWRTAAILNSESCHISAKDQNIATKFCKCHSETRRKLNSRILAFCTFKMSTVCHLENK